MALDTVHEAANMPDAGPEPEIPARRRPTPRHPIISMQAAFDESLAEHTSGSGVAKPQLRFADAKTRREVLLRAKDDGPPLPLWRHRPGQESHELRRLLAQISFGVHLLLNGSATAVDSVVTILQGHIDEVDEFLEVTLEDIALATTDLQERLDHLKLPMSNMAVFEKMLEDRGFRLQILDGNEAIERIAARTTTALMQTVGDVNEGLRSTREFIAYLTEQQQGRWRVDQPGIANIYDAMRGNADGWLNAFMDLKTKGNLLHALTLKLTGVVSEMELKAGEVSRRTRFTIEPFSGPTINRPQSSQSSASTTRTESPPPTPGLRIPSSPPRLSLRLSSIIEPNGTGSSFFDIPTKRDTIVQPLQSPTEQCPDIAEEHEPTEIEIKFEEVEPETEEPETETRSETPADTPAEAPDNTNKDNNKNNDDDRDNPLYILQPRAYTPLPPAPLPSPRIQDAPPSEPKVERTKSDRESMSQKRTSLRQRVSLKTNPPESIQVPPPNAPGLRAPDYVAPQIYQGPDSAYGSDIERKQVNPTPPSDSPSADLMHDLTRPSFRRPELIPSPHSDQQHFRPVQASPHSPLQQRPHTSHSMARNPSFQPPLRNVPSAMGMSTLSNVTNATNGADSQRTLKKKRSAFGWLKKAFALDEEERAEFEYKKLQAQQMPYYDQRSPKFLDGRRIR